MVNVECQCLQAYQNKLHVETYRQSTDFRHIIKVKQL